MKGRVLPYCHEFAMTLVKEMVAEACSWTADRFEDSVELWQSCVSAVLFMAQLSRNAFEEFDLVPYLFCRLDQPGVKERCVEQWLSVPKAKHDRVTLRIMEEGSTLRRHFDELNPDGSNMHPTLCEEVLGDLIVAL